MRPNQRALPYHNVSLSGLQRGHDLNSPPGRRVKSTIGTDIKRRLVIEEITPQMRSSVAKYAVTNIVPELEDASLIEFKVKGDTLLEILQKVYMSFMKRVFEGIENTERVSVPNKTIDFDKVNLNYSESPENKDEDLSINYIPPSFHLGERRNFSNLILNCLSPFSPTRKSKAFSDIKEQQEDNKDESLFKLLSPNLRCPENKATNINPTRVSSAIIESPSRHTSHGHTPVSDRQACERVAMPSKRDVPTRSSRDALGILTWYTARNGRPDRKSPDLCGNTEMWAVGRSHIRETARKLSNLNKELQISIESSKSSRRNTVKFGKNPLIEFINGGKKNDKRKPKRAVAKVSFDMASTDKHLSVTHIMENERKSNQDPLIIQNIHPAYLEERFKNKILLRPAQHKSQRPSVIPKSTRHSRHPSRVYSSTNHRAILD